MMARTMMVAALALVAALVFGCPDKETDIDVLTSELETAAQQYNECFFWRDFDRAVTYVVADKRADFLAEVEPLRRGYTVDESRILDLQVGPSGEDGLVTVRRSFVQAPSVTLETAIITQEWVLKDQAWYIAGPPY